MVNGRCKPTPSADPFAARRNDHHQPEQRRINTMEKALKIKVSVKLLASLDSDARRFREKNVAFRDTISSLEQRIKGFEADCRGDAEQIAALRNTFAMKNQLISSLEQENVRLRAAQPATGSENHAATGGLHFPLEAAKSMFTDIKQGKVGAEMMTGEAAGHTTRLDIVRAIRALTGEGLKECKDVVESLFPFPPKS
jgi:ribosomal protein L7/L12